MKNLKKTLAGLLVAAAATAFFSCKNDTEDDDNLVVSFSETTDEVTKAKTITMSAPTEYDGYEVYVAYTLDGSEPNVEFDSDACTKAGITGRIDKQTLRANYNTIFNYGTALIYDASKKPSFDKPVTINARAFYFDYGSQQVKRGTNAQTYEVKFASSAAATTDSANNAKGTLTFKLASSGNTNSNHYYDTSDSTFTYNGTPNCYYQIQFSYKANGRGNWYLFIRQINNAKVIRVDGCEKSYFAFGTYTSNAFNSSSGTVQSDSIKLYRDGNVNVWKGGTDGLPVSSASTSSFDLDVASGKDNLVDDAKSNS